MPRITMQQIEDAVRADNMTGFCLACGMEQGPVEPDAEEYICEGCGEDKVSGAEQILLRLVP